MFVRRLVIALVIGTPVAGFSHPGHGIATPHVHGVWEVGVAAVGLLIGLSLALRSTRRS